MAARVRSVEEDREQPKKGVASNVVTEEKEVRRADVHYVETSRGREVIVVIVVIVVVVVVVVVENVEFPTSPMITEKGPLPFHLA